MKKSRQSKTTTSGNAVDFISDLPDPILDSILSRLPTTEEVIRTSILSKRWRYLWKSIPSFPSLDIDCTRQTFEKKKFQDFVFWALEYSPYLDLDSFRLCCSDYYHWLTLALGVHTAVDRKVKLLDLMFCFRDEDENDNNIIDDIDDDDSDDYDDNYIGLPHCLVTSESLESLRLFLYKRPLWLSDYKGFPALRVLELNSVKLLDDDLVKVFLQNCPLLEELSLIDCLIHRLEALYIFGPKLKTLRIDNWNMVDGSVNKYLYDKEGLCNALEICCPELVFLEYKGLIAYVFSFIKLDSLKKAVICPEDMLQKDMSFPSFGDTICELFAAVSHVEFLSLNQFFIQAVDAAHDMEEDFPQSLPNLKTLDVTTTIESYTMNVILQILKRCHNLESLHLIIQKEFSRPPYWELDEFETRRILTCHLKRVEFLDFDGEKQKIDIACLLMEHGDELEEMVFSWRDKVKYSEKSTETMNQVSLFQKTSTVKLITLLKD